jgi:hypothetical protein
MRKLILITVLMLASASAFAGETRSLTLASNDVLAAPSQPTVDRASVSKVAVRLAQAAAPATIQSDAAPTLPQTTTTTTATQAPAPAPVQTAAPVSTTEPATTTTTTTTADTKPAKTATKTTRRESDEQKARRIAARYGVHW